MDLFNIKKRRQQRTNMIAASIRKDVKEIEDKIKIVVAYEKLPKKKKIGNKKRYRDYNEARNILADYPFRLVICNYVILKRKRALKEYIKIREDIIKHIKNRVKLLSEMKEGKENEKNTAQKETIRDK